jgi:hypothetical protein
VLASASVEVPVAEIGEWSAFESLQTRSLRRNGHLLMEKRWKN